MSELLGIDLGFRRASDAAKLPHWLHNECEMARTFPSVAPIGSDKSGAVEPGRKPETSDARKAIHARLQEFARAADQGKSMGGITKYIRQFDERTQMQIVEWFATYTCIKVASEARATGAFALDVDARLVGRRDPAPGALNPFYALSGSGVVLSPASSTRAIKAVDHKERRQSHGRDVAATGKTGTRNAETPRPRWDPEELKKIFKNVEQRKFARAHTAWIRTAAIAAFDALVEFYEHPSSENLETFDKAERDWAEFATKKTKSYATELRKVFRAGCRHFPDPTINGNWSKKYAPATGFIYAFWSTAWPNLVKIGATSRHPVDRQDEFKKRHQLEHLEIVFFLEISEPVKLEHQFHKKHGPRLLNSSGHNSREWFDFSPAEALAAVNALVEALGLRRLNERYENKRILEMNPHTLSISDAHSGARRVSFEK